MKLFDEIRIEDIYKVDGKLYTIEDIRITNIHSCTKFIVAASFKSIVIDNVKPFFEENVKNIIGNTNFVKIN